MKKYVITFLEKFGQAFTACLLAMVQGDITVLTLKHAMVAGKTGALTGVAFILASLFKFTSRYFLIFLTGLLTAIADYITHPTHYGPAFMEAVVTGAVAMLIAYAYEHFYKRT